MINARKNSFFSIKLEVLQTNSYTNSKAYGSPKCCAPTCCLYAAFNNACYTNYQTCFSRGTFFCSKITDTTIKLAFIALLFF